MPSFHTQVVLQFNERGKVKMEKNYYNEFDKMEFVGLLSQRGNEVLPKLQEIL